MPPALEVAINSLSCQPGFYLSFDLVCLLCDSNCPQCQGDASFCTKCNQNFVLSANNTCICAAGYSLSGTSCVPITGQTADQAVQITSIAAASVLGAASLPVLIFAAPALILSMFDVLQMLK